MDFIAETSFDRTWWVFTLPAILQTQNSLFLLLTASVTFLSIALLTWASSPGGSAWSNGRNRLGRVTIPGPRGLPLVGSLFSLSRSLAHRVLASTAETLKGQNSLYSGSATQLMALSLGSTPAVVTSHPEIAREILTSSCFADRPIKRSAKLLMFSRAIGFAPNGSYWRLLRRISSTHLFSPKRVAAHEAGRQLDCAEMLRAVSKEQILQNGVVLRKHLQNAALNNIMGTVFGKRYDFTEEHNEESMQLTELVREGFELLGAFNWSDYLPWLSYFYDPVRVHERCSALVPRVQKLVKRIINEHRSAIEARENNNGSQRSNSFVDVLLSLDGEEKLEDDDMVAVLWEMIFRGTDTTALLTEWVMAELVLNPNVQAKLQEELDIAAGPKRAIIDADVAKLPYLQAVIKETLRLHPPGPLLSWARLSTSDVQLSNGMVVPADTTAMVNMWAITHDPRVWDDPHAFKPERFLGVGADVDVRGSDLRLAPFGAGRRVCPGKNLGLVTVGLWVAKLVHHLKWVQDESSPVDLTEVLKLSCEMKKPLCALAVPRDGVHQPFLG